ncbi:sensor domain-containing diguanylate cyclase [Conexibacter sp. CPCC 206217]|uniref:sensor domain-containing diguanylate cyclase n=1 Tax=Conexibacter sp. CPCC 206217 TaxID=3064574 RepID=UPI0027288958|nr:sensor domain-containing diguanylate cyclase [Conexibacter sp. CPCC 206217]MDO8210640.1 diguanylate cyclase [Conexibacter sp. CPCC 206217]
MDARIRHPRALAWTGAVGAGYLGLACAGLKLVDPDDGAAVIWPAAGLAMGALVVAPRRMWPALAVVILLANFAAQILVRGSTVPISAAIAVTGLLQSFLAALVMLAIAGERRPRIGSPRTVAGLFAGAVIGGGFAAVLGASVLSIGVGQEFQAGFLGWWLGNAIGMIVVAPVMLAIARPSEQNVHPAEAVGLIVLTAGAAVLLFGRVPQSGLAVFSVSYMIIPFLLWCAIRAGAGATTIASLLVATIATLGTIHDRGPFAAARFSEHESAQVLQGFLAIVVLTTLVVGAVVADQRRARGEARSEADRLTEALAALRTAQEDLRTVFERAPIGHAIVGPDGISGTNAALTAITGYDVEALRELGAEVLARPQEDLAPLTELLEELQRDATCSGEAEIAIVHRDGHVVELAVYLAVLGGTDRATRRTLLQVVDVSERKQLETRLRQLADRDPLTGLLNRRSFDKELTAHLARARRYGGGGALIVLDLDGFKRVNDSRGHHVGDELLVSVATLLTRRLRATDVVARLGGDEFAVLLPHADRSDAAYMAQSLVTAVRSELDVTTSLGVAMVGAGGSDSASQLLISADRAMYLAKEAGRDRHAFFALDG